MSVSKNHPRYISLQTRGLLEQGVKIGITSLGGLIAHGRGEAFDYLLQEKTHDFAKKSIDTAACLLLLAKHPVISVNGNTAALVPEELVDLSKLLNAPLEVNLFHESKKREKLVRKFLLKNGAKNVLLPQKTIMPYISSNRKFVNKDGIAKADVVFVPLEDGDRTEALLQNNKKVITVDLNPLSRTAKKATITIVDNIVRAMPILIKEIVKNKRKNKKELERKLLLYYNKKQLRKCLSRIVSNLS